MELGVDPRPPGSRSEAAPPPRQRWIDWLAGLCVCLEKKAILGQEHGARRGVMLGAGGSGL
jgi:hypothetical protein